ncbi:hypothetical protein E8E14_012993 [Neopestalotiopsis sp. 37M]|nr:hypothetical protein E8E14_012993 [Neopestalotiopsis sp. 37M]
MASNEWLPPGWTEDMLETATDEQWDALTEEQYERITAHQLSQSRAQQAVNETIFGTTAAPGPHQQQTTDTNVVGGEIEANIIDAMQKMGLSEFGFVVFRVRDAKNVEEEKWERVKTELWPALANDGRVRRDDGNGHPWPVWKWIDDDGEGLQALSVDAIARRYEALQAGGEIPAGLDQGIALVVTSEALDSFDEHAMANTAEEEENNNDDDNTVSGPWVYAVDVNYQDEEDEEDGGEEEDIKGYFKVSVRSLLPDLWPVLAVGALMPDELEAMVAEGGIWDGVY